MSKDKNFNNKEKKKKLGQINELDDAALSEASGGYLVGANHGWMVYDDKTFQYKDFSYNHDDAIAKDKKINNK